MRELARGDPSAGECNLAHLAVELTSVSLFSQCRVSLSSQARVRGHVTRLGCLRGFRSALLVFRWCCVCRAAFRRPRSRRRCPPRFLGFACRLFFATSLRLYLVVVSFGGGRCSDRCILASISGFRFVICFFLPFAFSVFSSSSLPLSSVALASYFLFLSVSVGRILFLLVRCCSTRLRSSSACLGICALSLSLPPSSFPLFLCTLSLSLSVSVSVSAPFSLTPHCLCLRPRTMALSLATTTLSHHPAIPPLHLIQPTNRLACPATTSPTSTHHHTPPPPTRTPTLPPQARPGLRLPTVSALLLASP